MRPLTLEIAGLRSYRGRTQIDFPQEGGLIGVIGDTGSGKSSILEAMVAALYAKTSWKGGELSDLRNSSEETMRIVFTFEVDGTRWRVTRTSSRKNYPPAVHELECVDEPGDIYSGKAEVDGKIFELIGLDYDAFKSTVILPQGNFERLLKASAGDRNDILMRILRLDQLQIVRSQAVESQLGLTKLLSRADVVRAGFGNPEQDALEAAEKLAEAIARRDVLRNVAAEIGSAEKSRVLTTDRVAQLKVAALGLDSTPAGRSVALGALATTLDTIEAERLELLERQRREQASAERVRAEIDAAADRGESTEVLAAARAVLEAHIRELPELESARADVAARTARLVQQEQAMTGLRAARDAATLASDECQRDAEGASARFLACTERCQSAVNAVERWREGAAVLADAEHQLATARSKLVPAQSALTLATSELAEARRAEARADAELTEAHRHDHAAAAAEGLVTGDLCPVCNRILPADFAAPAPSEGVDVATAQHAAAREATLRAVAAESAARHAVQAVESTIAAAETAFAKVTERCVSDVTALRQYSDAEPDLALETPVILAGLFDERSRLATERDRALGVARQAAADRTDRETDCRLAEQAIATETVSLVRDTRSLDARMATSESARQSLPDAFRPQQGDNVPTFQSLLEGLNTRLHELSDLANARDAAVTAAAAAGQALANLSERRRAEVDDPLHALLRTLSTLADRACAAAALLNTAEPARLDEHLPLPFLAAAAAHLERCATELRTALSAALADAEQELRTYATRIDDVLLSVAVETTDQLQSELEAAGGQMLLWQATEQRARELIEPAKLLDCAIAPVRDRTTALEEVAALLQRNAFIKEVAERRQQALLGHASRILLSMTNGRYGFDKKFAIADTLTGVARKVDTLSGGETFLASLALALGLVEVARLSGGRLDAIFLDEGFGSLDQAALDQAIAALDAAAIEGRTVGVVTHVRRVMDNIDRILAVTRTPQGSRATWLAPQQRDSLVETDVAAAMLA
jgi:exonuclease SbcC